jgi:hypothetical protein
VAAKVFCSAVDNKVGARQKWVLVYWSCKCAVNYCQGSIHSGNLCDKADIENLKSGIGGSFKKNQPGAFF